MKEKKINHGEVILYCDEEIKQSFFYKSSGQRSAIIKNWTGLYSDPMTAKNKKFFIKIKPETK